MANVETMHDRDTADELAKEIREIVANSQDKEAAFRQEMWSRGIDSKDAYWYMVHQRLFPEQHKPVRNEHMLALS